MQKVGQIVYQLEYYNNEGVQSLYTTQINGINIDITSKKLFANKKIKKLGIQAPPGSQFFINNTSVLIGRSGIYELDAEEISITTVYTQDTNIHNVIIDYIYEESTIS